MHANEMTNIEVAREVSDSRMRWSLSDVQAGIVIIGTHPVDVRDGITRIAGDGTLGRRRHEFKREAHAGSASLSAPAAGSLNSLLKVCWLCISRSTPRRRRACWPSCQDVFGTVRRATAA
jgi:hypothetical protein